MTHSPMRNYKRRKYSSFYTLLSIIYRWYDIIFSSAKYWKRHISHYLLLSHWRAFPCRGTMVFIIIVAMHLLLLLLNKIFVVWFGILHKHMLFCENVNDFDILNILLYGTKIERGYIISMTFHHKYIM